MAANRGLEYIETMESKDAITILIENFAKQLVAITQAAAEERLRAAMGASFGAPAKRGRGRPSRQAAAASPSAVGKRRMTVTPKVAQARKLQGRYLGALRSLNQANRAKVKATAKVKGVAAALKLALSLKPKK